MPNHVTNVIALNGDRKQICELLERIKNDEYGVGTVDFQKILPMPDKVYKGNLSAAEKAVHGKNNWYDWSFANWGTKWNSYGYEKDKDYTNAETLRFLTAWAAPHPVMQRLSEMFPEIEITHEWADEDIGMNCGRFAYYNGERCEEYFPETEKERLEFAARVMEIDLEDYGLFLNAAGTEYIKIPDEDFEIIEVAGITALFTDKRLTDADIPKGLYCYHLREADDGDRFCSLEKIAAVNHGGSVITSEPLNLGEQKYIALDDDSSPNFLEENCSIENFMQGDFEQSEDMEITQY